jgi:CubicO group peptidase (beta-lactamase class C family)
MLSGRDGFAKARNGRNEVTLSIGPPLRIYFRTHSFELLASVNSTRPVPAAQPHASAGRSFGWIGGYGSSSISDPSRDLTMILLTQHEFSSAGGDPIHQEFQATRIEH